VLAAGSAREAGRIITRQEQDKQAILNDQLRKDMDTKPRAEIITADFRVWAPVYKGPRFNFAHVDFPYGAGADGFGQGSMPVHGDYGDSPEIARELCETLFANQDRLFHDQAFMILWYQTKQNADGTVYRMLSKGGWDVCPNPLVWDKCGAAMGGDLAHDPRHTYETAFLCSRGNPVLRQQKADLFRHPIVTGRHANEKPEPMLKHFFEMVVGQYTRVLDPTCGSGSSIRAALGLGAEYSLGLEINEGFASRARLALDEAPVDLLGELGL